MIVSIFSGFVPGGYFRQLSRYETQAGCPILRVLTKGRGRTLEHDRLSPFASPNHYITNGVLSSDTKNGVPATDSRTPLLFCLLRRRHVYTS